MPTLSTIQQWSCLQQIIPPQSKYLAEVCERAMLVAGSLPPTEAQINEALAAVRSEHVQRVQAAVTPHAYAAARRFSLCPDDVIQSTMVEHLKGNLLRSYRPELSKLETFLRTPVHRIAFRERNGTTKVRRSDDGTTTLRPGDGGTTAPDNRTAGLPQEVTFDLLLETLGDESECLSDRTCEFELLPLLRDYFEAQRAGLYDALIDYKAGYKPSALVKMHPNLTDDPKKMSALVLGALAKARSRFYRPLD